VNIAMIGTGYVAELYGCMLAHHPELKSVELANAITLSYATNSSLDLPVDRAAYDAFIRPKAGDHSLSIPIASI